MYMWNSYSHRLISIEGGSYVSSFIFEKKGMKSFLPRHLKSNGSFLFKKFNGRSLKTLIFRLPDMEDSQTLSSVRDAKIVKLFSQDAIDLSVGVLFGLV